MYLLKYTMVDPNGKNIYIFLGVAIFGVDASHPKGMMAIICHQVYPGQSKAQNTAIVIIQANPSHAWEQLISG